MMKFIPIILVFVSSFSLTALGNTSSNPDQERAVRVQYAILLFNQKNGRLPHSWTELRQLKESSTYVKLVEDDMASGYENDFVRTFRFIPSGTEIRIRGDQERVIAMATRSTVPVRSGPEKPNLRLMVIQTADGNISTRQYSEEVVANLFRLAGFSISDYTGKDGKWEPEPDESDHASSPPLPTNPAPVTNPKPAAYRQEKHVSRKNLPSGTNDENETGDSRMLPLLIASFTVLLALGFMAWIKLRKNRIGTVGRAR